MAAPPLDLALDLAVIEIDASSVDGPDLDGSTAATPPSCARGLTCPGGLSCCHNVVIPGGTFAMGRSTDGSDACPKGATCSAHEQPEHPATVSSFVLDTFEVTVGRFRAFVQYLEANPGWQPAPGAGRHPRIASSGWAEGWSTTFPSAETLKKRLKCEATRQTWTDTPGSNELLPINCINWFEAFAFCAWDGGRLPTEAEWEYVAAGGEQNRVYPWGADPPDCEHANVDIGLRCAGAIVAPLPVGLAPLGNGRWGHRDLSGNILEWVLDRDAPYSTATCDDCAVLSSVSYRVLRGGSYGSTPDNFRVTSRGLDSAALPYHGMGVRCARPPAQATP